MPDIRAEMADGTTYEATVPGKSYMGFGDRVAFERRYGTSIPAVAQQVAGLFTEDDDGERVMAADADLSQLREEHHAFFAWRGLSRDDAGRPNPKFAGGFDSFVDALVDLEIDHGTDEDPPEPATPDS